MSNQPNGKSNGLTEANHESFAMHPDTAELLARGARSKDAADRIRATLADCVDRLMADFGDQVQVVVRALEGQADRVRSSMEQEARRKRQVRRKEVK